MLRLGRTAPSGGAEVFVALSALLSLGSLGLSSQAVAQCAQGQIAYTDQALGRDCPRAISDTCVLDTGDILVQTPSAWKRLANNEALPPGHYEFIYLANRLDQEDARSEALLVKTTKHYNNESTEFYDVLLSRNRGDAFNTSPLPAFAKEDYQKFVDAENDGDQVINAWHSLANNFDPLSPTNRRRALRLSSKDAAASPRLPHVRLYTFDSGRKLSCIPFDFDWQEGVESVDIVINELSKNDPNSLLSRHLTTSDGSGS